MGEWFFGVLVPRPYNRFLVSGVLPAAGGLTTHLLTWPD